MDCTTITNIFHIITPFTLPIISVYLVSVFRLVEYRDKNNVIFSRTIVPKLFKVWCSMLAFYSLCAFLSLTPYAVKLIADGTFLQPSPDFDWRENPTCCFWVMTFFLSKFVELGDTFFIIFLNRPLILLQWFHHMTTLLYVEHALVQRRFSSFWFIYMNVFVHSFMYSYYVKRYIQPWVITSLQLIQMIVGLSIVVMEKNQQFDLYGGTMYTLYAFLFGDYFVKRYIFTQKERLKHT